MSEFARFMKANKVQKANTFYAATKSLVDDSGEPLQWEIRPISTRENERIREACLKEVPTGKPNVFRPKLDTSAYMAKLICASVVSPNLRDAELQDSYGVKTPEDLLLEMVDDPGEYNDFIVFVQEYCGFTETLEEKVEAAKN